MGIDGYEIRLQGLPLPIIIALAAVAVFIVIRYYRFLKDVGFPNPAAPLLLRAVAFTLLFLLAAGPTIYYERKVPEARRLAVIIDTSQSMMIGDSRGVTRKQKALQALRAISKAWGVVPELFTFDEELVRRASIEEIEGIKPGGRETHLIRALKNIPSTGENRISDAIVITDGNDTSGLSISTQSAARVHVLGAGDAAPRPNAGLYRLEAPEYGFVGSPVVVQGDIYASDMPGGTVIGIELFEDGIRVGQETLESGVEPGSRQRFSISYEPRTPGYRSLEVRLKTSTGDVILQDNKRTLFIDIISGRRSILLVDAPGWEFRFLREYLESIEKLSVDVILTGPNGKTFEGRKLRENLSNSRTLGKYRLIIVGQAAKFLTPPETRAIAQYVSDGGRIVSLGGRNALPCTDNSLGKSLGFTSEKPGGDRVGFEPTLTDTGANSLPLRFAPDREANNRIWKNLPLIQTICMTSPGKDAVVLAVHPWMKCGGSLCPAVFTKTIGRGQAFVVTFEGLWRWRFRRKDSEHYATLWAGVLTEMLETENRKPVRISLKSDSIILGGEAAVTVNVEPGLPGENTAPSLEINGPQKDSHFVLDMKNANNKERLFFNAIYTPEKVGLYNIKAVVGKKESETLNFYVYASPVEFVSVAQNEKLNREVAEKQGGWYYPVEQANDLIKKLAKNINYRVERDKFTPWSSPYILLLIILLLTAEWIFRRRGGLT